MTPGTSVRRTMAPASRCCWSSPSSWRVRGGAAPQSSSPMTARSWACSAVTISSASTRSRRGRDSPPSSTWRSPEQVRTTSARSATPTPSRVPFARPRWTSSTRSAWGWRWCPRSSVASSRPTSRARSRWGIPGASTACDTPWHHTTADTPDKVDLSFLARAAARWRRTIAALDSLPDAAFAPRDPHLWRLQVSVTPSDEGLLLQARATLADETPAQDAWVDVDDFTRVFRTSLRADPQGAASTIVPRAVLQRGAGGRYLHVTAGAEWPLAEWIVPLH